MEDLVERMKEKVMKGGDEGKLAVAPQFDGLYSFETLVLDH